MLTVWAPAGVGEIAAGDDLAATLLAAVAADGGALREGDIVVITSKVVSKAEGLQRHATRDEALPGQTRRIVARRGPTRIVRNLLGLTMAAAGIDASNVEAGTILVLPTDPDATARAVRAALQAATGLTLGVIITDTAGRAWRDGQTDIAIGAAGLTVLESFAGVEDAYGNPLVVTAPAVADELASAAELGQGKLGARPFAVISGRADLVLPADQDGTGAGALIRAEGSDLFGYGAREAVVRALKGDPADRLPFGAPSPAADLIEALAELGVAADPSAVGADGETVELALAAGTDTDRLAPLFFAFGWKVDTFTDACPHVSPQTP
ncbi:coenzyme F420-0:L-glutamate ligase [Nocardioides sp.]|uniref:coenzyme F420-0:L-glutamate ligase n=1 Tax=Nocardioides sp. TaxID=35761 RepID=UPI00262427A6|nr:coenzyme F420-0:L-glutamate ligase [Nocardioides sp.]